MANFNADVVVSGGGAAGIAAAIAAAKCGKKVALAELADGIGGDLFSGMPLLGAFTARGVQISRGVLDELLDACRAINPASVIGPVCDYRTVVGLCVDPEVLKLAVYELIRKYRITLFTNTMITGAQVQAGRLTSVKLQSKNAAFELDCRAAVDATGGGYLTKMGGGKVLFGSEEKEFQPLSMVFRMENVDYEALLQFVADNPQDILLCENSALPKERSEAVRGLLKRGMPYIAISSASQLFDSALKSGKLHPFTAAFITPTSPERMEVCLNVTRIAKIDCANDGEMSGALPLLAEQVMVTEKFFRQNVPGFQNARLSCVYNRCGVRESGRIDGEYTLTQSDVVEARRFPDAVAQGCHHVDIHGSGTKQVRIPVKDGLCYDIPAGCLRPKGLVNVFAAGRCISSDRGANGSARVMGTCLSTGQAAGKLAAECAD